MTRVPGLPIRDELPSRTGNKRLKMRGTTIKRGFPGIDVHSTLSKIGYSVDHLRETASKPVKPCHDRHVALTHVFQGLVEAGTGGPGAADRVSEHLLATVVLQGLALSVQGVALALGADTSVTDEHQDSPTSGMRSP